MALICAEDELRGLVPEAHLKRVRFEGLPPDDCWIGYSSWSGDAHLFVGDLIANDKAVNPPTEHDAYSAVLCFGSIALKAVGMIDPLRPPSRLGGQGLSSLMVWPEQSDLVQWPPPGVPASDAVFERFVASVPIVR
jgi:hypothetical protein